MAWMLALVWYGMILWEGNVDRLERWEDFQIVFLVDCGSVG